MHTVNAAGLAGVGFLAIGALLSVPDLGHFNTFYALIMGPILWIVGCALMVAWAIGRVGLAGTGGSKTYGERPAGREQSQSVKPQETSQAAAAACHKNVVAGHCGTDFLVPLAIWLMLVSFIGTIVLLLGYGLP